MVDNLKRRQPEDAHKININQGWELESWSKKLGVSKEQLKQAVKKVGPSVVKVREYLGRPHLKRARR